nr:MAG TPA: hypothetical protein [Caudoviricetes sp.]
MNFYNAAPFVISRPKSKLPGTRKFGERSQIK